MAFFLESTFMGVWIFCWDRLNKTVHATCSNIGCIRYKFIRILDSCSKLLFMQHPVGYVIRNGRAEMENFATIVLNGYVPGQFAPYCVEWFINSRRNYYGYQCMALDSQQCDRFLKRSAKWGMVIALNSVL